MNHPRPRSLLPLVPVIVTLGVVGWLSTESRTRAAGDSKEVIAFQCRLISSGVPLEGPVTLAFQIFEAESGGSPISGWAETHTLTAQNGVISVRLGEQSPLGGLFVEGTAGTTTTNRYVAVKLNSTGGSEVLTPRAKLSAVPYCLSASMATVASKLWSTTGNLDLDALPLLSGRSGGQTITGGTQNDNDLTLQSTSGTGGYIVLGSDTKADNGLLLKHMATPASAPSGYTAVYAKSDGKVYRLPSGGSESEVGAAVASPTVLVRTAEGRLSCSSTEPVPTGSTNRGTSLYYLPYSGNQVALYSGSSWVYRSIASVVTLTNASLSADVNYDVYLYDNAGAPTLEATSWTSATVRTTEPVRLDGVWVKTGATTRRYLGTVRTISDGGTTKFVDEPHRRYVYNAQNRVKTSNYTEDTTNSWSESGNGAWSVPGAGTSVWKWEFVIGLDGLEPVEACAIIAKIDAGSIGYALAVTLDATTPSRSSPSAWPGTYTNGTSYQHLTVPYQQNVAVGHHYVQAVETGIFGGTVTVYGDDGGSNSVQSGMWFTVWR